MRLRVSWGACFCGLFSESWAVIVNGPKHVVLERVWEGGGRRAKLLVLPVHNSWLMKRETLLGGYDFPEFLGFMLVISMAKDWSPSDLWRLSEMNQFEGYPTSKPS